MGFENLPYDRGDAALVAYLNGLAAQVVCHNWMNCISFY